jgi:hypothetical protein
LADAYTLNNLKPSTAYKVQVTLVFQHFRDRIMDYWDELKIPGGENELKPLESDIVFFNTA